MNQAPTWQMFNTVGRAWRPTSALFTSGVKGSFPTVYRIAQPSNQEGSVAVNAFSQYFVVGLICKEESNSPRLFPVLKTEEGEEVGNAGEVFEDTNVKPTLFDRPKMAVLITVIVFLCIIHAPH